MGQPQISPIPRTKEEFRELAKRMEKYSKCTRALNKDWPQLMKQFPQEWVAYYEERMCAHSSSYDDLLSELENKGIPLKETAVRYMDTNPQTLIL